MDHQVDKRRHGIVIAAAVTAAAVVKHDLVVALVFLAGLVWLVAWRRWERGDRGPARDATRPKRPRRSVVVVVGVCAAAVTLAEMFRAYYAGIAVAVVGVLVAQWLQRRAA